MAQLRLFWVQCENQQEIGSDEIYFTFDDMGGVGEGRTNTITGMDEGDRFNMTDRFNFDGTVIVRLFEDDLSADDRIGTEVFAFDASEAGENQTAVFQGKGAEYLLRYDIIA